MFSEARPLLASAPWHRCSQSEALKITERQREVVELIAAGLSNDEVGERLGISPRTAKAHCDVLRQKLGVARRRQIPVAYRLLTGEDPLLQSLGPAPPTPGTDGPVPAAPGRGYGQCSQGCERLETRKPRRGRARSACRRPCS